MPYRILAVFFGSFSVLLFSQPPSPPSAYFYNLVANFLPPLFFLFLPNPDAVPSQLLWRPGYWHGYFGNVYSEAQQDPCCPGVQILHSLGTTWSAAQDLGGASTAQVEQRQLMPSQRSTWGPSEFLSSCFSSFRVLQQLPDTWHILSFINQNLFPPW